MLGGATTERASAFYRRAGFSPPTSTNPDHIGVQCSLLTYLSIAEADAWQDGAAAQAARMRHLQREFLDQHVLTWLLPLVHAIYREADTFYVALAQLTVEVVAGHYAALDDVIPLTPFQFALPDTPDLLGDEATRLKDIATYLLTPAYSGIFISRDEIRRMARQLRLSHGFGDRPQMLSNLMQTAVDYDQFSSLITQLEAICQQWHSFYNEQQSLFPDAYMARWADRLEGTRAVLGQIHEATSTGMLNG